MCGSRSRQCLPKKNTTPLWGEDYFLSNPKGPAFSTERSEHLLCMVQIKKTINMISFLRQGDGGKGDRPLSAGRNPEEPGPQGDARPMASLSHLDPLSLRIYFKIALGGTFVSLGILLRQNLCPHLPKRIIFRFAT